METEFKDLKLSELNLEKVVNTTGEVSPVTTLSIMINNKHDKLEELQKAVNDKNPTEKQTQAYIENTYKEDFDALKIAEENTKLIKRQLDLIDDRISLEKYAIQLELKK